MLGDIKKAFRKSAVFAIGNMSTKLIGLILIPLYTDQTYLSVKDYGSLSVLEITSQVLIAIMGLTLSHSMTRWYWDAKYVPKQKSIFFTSLVTLIGISMLVLMAVIPLSGGISTLLFGSKEYSYIIILLIINCVLQIIISQAQTLLKLQSKAFFFSIISILKLTLSLLFTIYFIVYKGKKLDGIFEAQIIGSAVVLVILVPYIIRNSKIKFESLILLEMLNYSYPLMLASISGVFFSVIDRYSLNYLDGLENVGVYTLGYKIASTLKVVVIASIQMALTPIQMKKINDSDNQVFYASVMTYFSLALMFCIVGVSLFSLEIIKFASRDVIYWESANIVAILSFSFFFSMLKDAAFIGLHVVKRTKISGALIALSSLINLGLNILLIPRFSIYGAAVGTLLSQIIFFIMIYYSAQKLYHIPYELNKVIGILIIGIILVAAGFLTQDMTLIYRLLIKALLLISFPALVFLSKIFNPKILLEKNA